MKHPKHLISLAVIALLSGLILAASYNNFANVFQSNVSEQTPQPPQLQVFSPQDNGTYQTANVPLNITANNSTTKINYSLDGIENITFNENATATSSLLDGVHDMTVYGFDSEGKLCDSKNVTFTVQIPYPSGEKLTMQQVQEIASYFESNGFTLRVFDSTKPQWWLHWDAGLNSGVVQLETKEALATFAAAHGITELREFIEPPSVSFNAYVYNNSPLPVIYTFSVKIS
jgi:hypothetical protein